MTSPSGPLSTVYCTDEDIAVRAGGDYTLLCPKWQKLAGSNDGIFSSGTPWVLHSASLSFTGSGIGPGSVVWITGNTTTFKGSGELFGVDSVTATAITLHRIGLASGAGLAPGPPAGVTGLNYQVLTFYPQIENESYSLNRKYNIDPGYPGRTPTDMFDLRDLQDACVVTVIVNRLVAEVQDFRNGAWSAKLNNYQIELTSIMDKLQIRWGQDESSRPNTNWFTTRLVR